MYKGASNFQKRTTTTPRFGPQNGPIRTPHRVLTMGEQIMRDKILAAPEARYQAAKSAERKAKLELQKAQKAYEAAKEHFKQELRTTRRLAGTSRLKWG